MRAKTRVSTPRFRRLTLRSATGTAQRAIPTMDSVKLRLTSYARQLLLDGGRIRCDGARFGAGFIR
jgi:hypothetical protein